MREAMNRLTEKPASEVRSKKKNWKLRLVLILIVLPAVLISGYTFLALNFAYSSGERAGYVQKISKKGWLCKTWEGELAMTTVPGTAPQLFEFSVRDDATARQIEQTAGRRVALAYEQHKGLPTSCFGDTEYFVTGVRTVGQ
jgi:hypothetical protein